MKSLPFAMAIISLWALANSPAQARDPARLGVSQKAGPFQITLTTIPAAPQSGSNRFQVQVSREGKAVKNALVKLTLTMPLHRHGGRSDREPQITRNLGFVQGAYQGQARLTMAAVWLTKVDVKTSTGKGTAFYRFTANKPTPVHLGMGHMADEFVGTLTTGHAMPQVGENQLRPKITRENQPIDESKVSITLNQSALTTDSLKVIPLSEAALRGVYPGTVILPATGEWEAYVAVEANAKKGDAFYQFRLIIC